MPAWLRNLPPNQRRIAAAAIVGAVLALGTLIMRRGKTPASSADTPTAGPTVATPTSPGDGYSTFADNGAGFGELSNSFADLYGGLQVITDRLDELPSSIEEIVSRPATTATPPVDSAPPPPAPPPAQLASVNGSIFNPPSTGPPPIVSGIQLPNQYPSRPNVLIQDSGPRAGLGYIVKRHDNGKNYRHYESKFGRGDWGQGGIVPQ